MKKMLRNHSRNDEGHLQRRDTLKGAAASTSETETEWLEDPHQSRGTVVSEWSKMMRGQDHHFRQNSRVILSLRLWAETSPHTLTTESHRSAMSGHYNSCLTPNAQQQQVRLHPLTDLPEDSEMILHTAVRRLVGVM